MRLIYWLAYRLARLTLELDKRTIMDEDTYLSIMTFGYALLIAACLLVGCVCALVLFVSR